MRINIYQIDSDKDTKGRMFLGYDMVGKDGVDPEIYKKVYSGYTEVNDLEDIFKEFNSDFHGTMQGHSLSVSDIVEVCEGNENVAEGTYFCDSIGYKKLDGFDTPKCAEMDGLRVLMIEPNRPPVETRLPDELEKLQRAVSPDGSESFIEITYPFRDNAVVLGNEEAKLIGMKGNRHIGGSVYAGQIYVIGDNGDGEFCDLTDKQIEKYSKMFAEPEHVSDDEVMADKGFIVYGY